MSKALQRSCPWCEGDELYRSYHDREWGVPLKDDQQLFEFLLLEGAQAGLSWITVLRKREGYREAFNGFDPEKMACFTDKKLATLMNDSRIIRNRLKIQSARQNAQAYIAIQESHASFASYIWQFVDGQPQQNQWQILSEVPGSTATSDQMSKVLKKAGFNFVGSTICYAFMQATGMVNDHLTNCFRHQACQKLAHGFQVP